MTTIAIVGAGSGLGASVARRFGHEGFSIALMSRTQANVDRLADELSADGITARGYVANTRDIESVSRALAAAAGDLGPIEVLQYSPIPAPEFLRPVLDTSVGDLTGAIEFSVYGSVTACQQVLPAMTERRSGTILLVNGSSGAHPNGNVAGTSVAFAAESAYGAMLHDAVAEQGVHVGQLIIPGAIGGGDPLYAPDALADRLWAMHTDRGSFRVTVGAEQD
ncbi:SDR family NAD(P)-dependent oxidoreductase [Rhodococcus sp. G-MC3]|uniref:SDR family NAD(P)-dependent oxidoreductase n=1 Tax=Rhodococcus sp. G-MC3 TaxID=3046209 RepID=UPI0024B8C9D4|nr:SDR family NAD(P)-dependent oxidoreductase [Rhodococcus sp. G-MC3]MDJ0392916.1 SDR family NAD(P)-dependent oxidoreductase [Rhodococcus sp. G-MC3]